MATPLLVAPDETAAADRQRRVIRAIATMRSEPGRVLTLDELAETASYSRYHFVRTFRETTGTSPGAFQTAMRFGRASELLLTTPASVTEVCGEVGYTSLGTFSDRFRELVGVSPSGLRELPHRIAALRAIDPFRLAATTESSRCRIRVVIPPLPASVRAVYVGLFPDGVPSGIPLSGMMVPGAGTVTLGGVPAGRYHVLAAAFSSTIDGLGHLLPGDGTLVGSTGRPIALSPEVDPIHTMRFRPIAPTDPPIVTALPALVLARLS